MQLMGRCLRAANRPGISFAGDEIWVAQGIYYPGSASDARTVTFQLKSDVAIYGGFVGGESDRAERDWSANPTILSGDIDLNDVSLNGVITDMTQISGSNAYHVVTGSGVGTTARLDGFTITAGMRRRQCLA